MSRSKLLELLEGFGEYPDKYRQEREGREERREGGREGRDEDKG